MTKVFLKLVVAMFLIFQISPSFSQNSNNNKAEVKINILMGKVEARVPTSEDWIPAETGMLFGEDDIIKTGEGASIVLTFTEPAQDKHFAMAVVEDNSYLILSQLSVDQEKNTYKIILDLINGQATVIIAQPRKEGSSFEVRTPTSVIDVKEGASTLKAEKTD